MEMARSANILWILLLLPLACVHLLTLLPSTDAIKWLALARSRYVWNSTTNCLRSRKHQELMTSQAKMCRRHLDLMPSVVTAAVRTMTTCQNVFQDRRWNCSSIQLAPKFTPDLTKGTREQAFVSALSSAAIVYFVARACSAGHVFSCGCALLPHDPPHGNFKWGGCGDNIKHGIKFSKFFVDVPWSSKKNQKNKKTLRATVSKHNHAAGRKAVEYSLFTQCKCHGVSGSCSIKTCWRSLPASLAQVGERLKRKYAIATEVVSRKMATRRQLQPASSHLAMFQEDDLVYMSKSPDYCVRDPAVGSIGTRGRWCNATSDEHSGCDSMCCGRGFHTYTIEKIERCSCKYVWCCYVKCKTCKNWVDVHECN